MTDDRRTDHDSRQRVEELWVAFQQLARRLYVGVCVLAVFLTLALVLSFVQRSQNARRVDDIARVQATIQAERTRNTFAACERANGQARAIVSFIAGTRELPPGLVGRARAAFPVRDCATVTATQVRTRP